MICSGKEVRKEQTALTVVFFNFCGANILTMADVKLPCDTAEQGYMWLALNSPHEPAPAQHWEWPLNPEIGSGILQFLVFIIQDSTLRPLPSL